MDGQLIDWAPVTAGERGNDREVVGVDRAAHDEADDVHTVSVACSRSGGFKYESAEVVRQHLVVTIAACGTVEPAGSS